MKQTKFTLIIILVIILIGNTVLSQGVAISNDGSSSDVSAVLDIKSTDKGVLIPRMTLSERDNISTPVTGLLIYQTDNTSGFYFYNGSNWVVVGSEAMDINSLSDGKTTGNDVFLGSGAGANIVGTNKYNTGVGHQALSLNTSGIYNTANGYKALFSNITGGFATATGCQALYSNTLGSQNTATGYQALYSNTTGNYNTAIGSQTLFSNSNADSNTANGYQALYWNTTGASNTATGYHTLNSNSTGNRNTAGGDEALVSNSTGNDNTAIGVRALGYNNSGSFNTANGDMVLNDNSTGSHNTANGDHSSWDNETGSYNTAIGLGSLRVNETGNYNTAIGSFSQPLLDNPENTTAVGSDADPTASNSIILGYNTTWNGGQVNWSTYSDKRAKSNIKEDVAGLDFILKLRPVSWYWDKDKLDAIIGLKDTCNYKDKYNIEKIKQSGFLAQEVEEAAMSSNYKFSGVHVPVNEHTPYSISYAEFVVPLVKAVQEQQQILTEQQQRLEILNKTFNDQEETIETFQEQNKVLFKSLEKLEDGEEVN